MADDSVTLWPMLAVGAGALIVAGVLIARDTPRENEGFELYQENILKKVGGRWAIVSRRTHRPLAYYKGRGRPPASWYRKQEARIQMFKHMHGRGREAFELPPGTRTERNYPGTSPLDITPKQIRRVVDNKAVGFLLVRARDFLLLTLDDFDRDVADARATGTYVGRRIATIDQYNRGYPDQGPPLLPPFLGVVLQGNTGKVVSHEGRHRALALYLQDEQALMWVGFELWDSKYARVLVPAGYAKRFYGPDYIKDPVTLNDVPARITAQFVNSRIVKLERFDALDPYDPLQPFAF